jgi:hypothetical protein
VPMGTQKTKLHERLAFVAGRVNTRSPIRKLPGKQKQLELCGLETFQARMPAQMRANPTLKKIGRFGEMDFIVRFNHRPLRGK